MLRSPVYLLGAGLITCLGRGLTATARALAQPLVRPGHTPDNWKTTPAPYHIIEGVEGRERLHEFLDHAIGQALHDSGLNPGQRRRLAILVGSTCLDLPLHETAYVEQTASGRATALMLGPGYGNVAAHVAQQFGITGPQYTLNTACSSSANALLHARRLLTEGLTEHALVIGVEACNRLSVQGFGSLQLLSRQAYSPFDCNRDGLILGEGAGAMVLGRAPRAADTHPVALGGAASACDPSSPTNSLPIRTADVMRAALDDAGLHFEELLAIKAHGTGTPSSDLSEGQAMRLLSGRLPPFTSLKPYMGHTLGGCGVIESLCLVAAWREGFLPATPGFTEMDPDIGVAPVTVTTPLGGRGAVLCNFFGFGGNNTSLVFGI